MLMNLIMWICEQLGLQYTTVVSWPEAVGNVIVYFTLELWSLEILNILNFAHDY